MERKLTITLSEDEYERPRRQAGSDDLREFVEATLRSFIQREERLEAGYREMAADDAHEREAMEWIEAVSDDALDE